MPSSQDKLRRVRKPRVHITYEVETEGAEVVKELPFVVGVMGDFSGDPTKKLEPLAKRKFVQIDRDNFNQVMENLNVGLELRVPNTMVDEEGKEMKVNLQFKSMDDFAPAAVAQQIEPLKKLLATRDQLRDLIAKIDRSPDLEGLLDKVLTDEDALKKITEELGQNASGGE
ncbi:MAG: type VI secretion system contractile sheath small subunit [Planctomycetales bacterium]|nr:type VI secretion system contractile sheath small subunit [Planctomycetales bacterium]